VLDESKLSFLGIKLLSCGIEPPYDHNFRRSALLLNSPMERHSFIHQCAPDPPDMAGRSLVLLKDSILLLIGVLQIHQNQWRKPQYYSRTVAYYSSVRSRSTRTSRGNLSTTQGQYPTTHRYAPDPPELVEETSVLLKDSILLLIGVLQIHQN
jgi:hypothetical protein